jgi:hypothetical protein
MLHNTVFICFAADVWSYVQQIRMLVEDLQGRVLKAQLNVDRIHNLINTWSLTPLFEHKNCKKKNLIYLDDHDERVFKRWVIYTREIIFFCCWMVCADNIPIYMVVMLLQNIGQHGNV